MSRRGYNQTNEVYTIIRVDTTKTTTGGSDANSIRLPMTYFSGIVDFGDGTIQSYDYSPSIVITHTYATSGIYTIRIRITNENYGQFFYNNGDLVDRLKLIEIVNCGKLYIGSSSFRYCTNLKMDKVVGRPRLRNNPTYAFADSGVTTINNIHLWDMSNVTTMERMFSRALKFNQDISGWTFNKDVNLVDFMVGKSAASYSPVYYSNLLIKLRNCVVGTGRTETKKSLTMQNLKYTSAGASARADLVADGWNIIDGGLA